MALPDIFSQEVTHQLIERINTLTPESKALWGKMSVAQMLAHTCVTYEMAFEDKHPKPNGFARLMLKLFVKKNVVNEVPYKKMIPTAPAFRVLSEKDFELEKGRLIHYLNKTVEVGKPYFQHKESLSFGILSINEWNNMFYKHLDHHLKQFGA